MPDYHVRIAGHPPVLLDRDRPELTLGRGPDLGISIDDPTISRHHARLLWREGSAWLEDLRSRHGCFKNGIRIKAPVPVTPQDRIALGRLALTLEPLPDPGADGPGGQDPEATPLTLPLADLRKWNLGGDLPGRFPNWREALDLLHGLSIRMLEDQEPAALLDDLLERLFSFLDATRGAALLSDGHGTLAPIAVRSREAAPEGPPSLSAATLEATLGRRAAIVFQEPASSRGGAQGLLAQSPTTSAMAVPIEHDGQVLGLFYFEASRERGAFNELDLRFVATLSNLAAAKLLAQRTAEALRRKQDLERELQAREAAAKAKGAFLAQVSHEIRTPMNVVLGFTRLALKEPLTPKGAEYLGRIERSGRSLMRLVNDVLDHSKLEAGGLALENIPFAPARLLEEVMDLFIPEAQEKGLSLRIVPGAGLPEECLGDPHRLGQVLTNLVGNAIKFTERGGVELRVEREEPRDDRVRLRFAVRDTGIGIPAGRLDQVFAPYAQADPSMARRYGGTGLGLAISKKLVEGMGGVLTAESSAAGSTFAFSLGFHPAPPRGADPGPPRGPEVPCLRGHRLLLVEDNPLNQQLASILLSESGAQVEVAQSGSEALARLQAEDFSAVLMDIHMPGMDGLETARRARAMGCSRPIIAMTAHTLDGHWEACREAGMDDFITKPIDPGLLFAALGRWVQEAPAPPSAGTRPGPPQGDPDALEALAGLLDLPTALGRIAGRADLLMGVIRSFLDEPIQPAAIEAALSRGDRAAACRMVHDLKGIAGILAMADLAEASAELEARLLEESPDTWADPFARLGPILSRFLAAARRAIGDAPPAGGLPP